jgi:2-C-methyl-D-erythritol 4-phosphate cytidylyltransferase
VTAQTARGDVAVLVPAAGSGVRLGPGVPKALRALAGVPLLVHAVRRLMAAPSVARIVVAAPPADVPGVTELLAGAGLSADVVPGGATRQASVAAALRQAGTEFPIVLVHDAARALAPISLIERVAAAVRDGHDAVIPVLPVVDTIKQVADGVVIGTVDRSVLRAVQTPQGFRREVLVAAHAAAVDEHTDDASMAEKLGVPVWTVDGDEAAMKITRPLDLRIAALLLDG